jgi:predicted transcriptional regulator YdeE
MEPTLVRYDGAVVLGLEIVTTNAAEADPRTGKIGPLWARYRQEDVFGKIPGKTAPPMPLAVYTSYQSGADGPYRLIAGAAVGESAPTPSGFVRVVVPAGRYLLFGREGEMPGIVVETWKGIWAYFGASGHEARAFTTDFERYPGPREVEVYVSVK